MNALRAYNKNMQILFSALRVDTSNEILGLYDYIYKYEDNKDVIWYDKRLMQILLLIELGDTKKALKLLKKDKRDYEREIFIEYDDGIMDIFEILEYALHNDIV